MTTDSTSDIAVRGVGLSKIFKDFWGRKKIAALSDVDIEINCGCVFGLLGPNGAGKSTLIKLILGHLYPTKGQLSVLGHSPRNVEVKQRIGYLPERSYLYKNLTASETLRYFGSILNLSKDQIRNRSDQLLQMVGLENSKKRMIGEFSYGMTRRMGLAQALLNDPDLLILDEPTAGLDPVGCREVKDLIITLGRRGKTVLLTTHLLADVEDVCDEILMLYGGRCQSKGSVDELLTDSERTVLEFPNVREETLENVKRILSDDIGSEQIVEKTPTDTLENYFLEIVSQSNANMKATAGAQMGRGVADYLQDDHYKSPDFLESLRPTSAVIHGGEHESGDQKQSAGMTAIDPVDSRGITEKQRNSALAELENLALKPGTVKEEHERDQPTVDKKLLDDLTKM